MKHIKTFDTINEDIRVDKSDYLNKGVRYFYTGAKPDEYGSGYVTDMSINADSGGLVIINGNSKSAKEFLIKAVTLMNK